MKLKSDKSDENKGREKSGRLEFGTIKCSVAPWALPSEDDNSDERDVCRGPSSSGVELKREHQESPG